MKLVCKRSRLCLRASDTGYQRAFKAGSQIGGLVRLRRDDSDQTPACAQSPARHGAATAVGVHRLWSGRGTSWYAGVGALLSGLPPLQSVFAMRVISTNPANYSNPHPIPTLLTHNHANTTPSHSLTLPLSLSRRLSLPFILEKCSYWKRRG